MTLALPAFPAQVAVIGAGRMGAGIAHAFLTAGATVQLIDTSLERARSGGERVRQALARSAAADTALDVRDAQNRLYTQVSVDGAPDLVVEAVPEDLAMKRAVLLGASQAAPDAVLASNTSSLSIDTLADGLPSPSALIGLHFFNPVPVSTLIEIVRGSQTAPEIVDAAAGWVQALGKTPITVRDSPGFATSRLGLVLGLEAIRMLEQGVARAEDIDLAMTLGYKHPIGPLALTDVVGLDVRLAIATHLERELGSRFSPPDLLRQLVAQGHLGRKSGQGFFRWEGGARA